jgi:hypothetical protein
MNQDISGTWYLSSLDITGDGSVTVADLWAWTVYLFFLPGDTLLFLLVEYAPDVASFFAVGPDSDGGSLSMVLSITAWLIIFIVISLIRDFDRALTANLSLRYREVERQLRVLRRMVSSRIGLIWHKHHSKTPTLHVAGIELSELEIDVLRCYSAADEFRVVAAEDIAATLEVPRRQVRTALRRLTQLHLIQPSFSTDEGREGHVITKAGQLYLLEA